MEKGHQSFTTLGFSMESHKKLKEWKLEKEKEKENEVLTRKIMEKDEAASKCWN